MDLTSEEFPRNQDLYYHESNKPSKPKPEKP